MVHKPEYRALIQPVPGIPEAAQRAIVAPYEPTEIYVCRAPEDFDAFLRQLRSPRVALVPHTGLLACQRGNVHDRQDDMAAMKAGIHKRKCHAVDARNGRSSKKDWPSMKADGNVLCSRLAQGRKSALNGKRGAKPWIGTRDEKDAIREDWYTKPGRTVDDAARAIKKRLRERAPGRTVLYREFGPPVTKKR